MRNRGYIFLISILLVIGLMPVSLINGETTPPTVDKHHTQPIKQYMAI